MTASQVAHPVPAAPIRSASATRTSSKVHLVLGVRRDGELLGERHPGGGGVDQEQVDVRSASSPVRARTTQARRRGGEGDVALGAGEAAAVTVGLGRHLDAGRPAAVLGLEPGRGDDGLAGHDAGQPRAASARADPTGPVPRRDRTALTKCGEGARARPSSS